MAKYYSDDVILAVSPTVSTSGFTILTFEASSDIQYAGDYTGIEQLARQHVEAVKQCQKNN